ncbi:FadR/GntR family transcriptional regulator [Bacillus sp. 1P06AnD]|uniref:FadR/GntR family transcriptional regulator n=1 Tax=Bacillus sp. 1P06AnD TaxID=3132208 RepID=UPI0039A089C4
MEYKVIKPRKLYEEVAENIHSMIRDGELKPGDKLDSVQQLAENFHVGRSAIREALSALRAKGLVEMKQGEGTYVKQFDASTIDFSFSSAVLMNKEDVVHLLEVRKAVEVGAARLAARNRNEEDLEMLGLILEEMKDAFGNDKREEETDIAFHLAISKATQNPMMYQLMQNVSDMMSLNMKETRKIWLYSNETTIETLYEDHAAITEAITAKDEKLAETMMFNHLTVVEKNMSLYYNDRLSEQ